MGGCWAQQAREQWRDSTNQVADLQCELAVQADEHLKAKDGWAAEQEAHQRTRDQLAAASGDLAQARGQLQREGERFQHLLDEGASERAKWAATERQLREAVESGERDRQALDQKVAELGAELQQAQGGRKALNGKLKEMVLLVQQQRGALAEAEKAQAKARRATSKAEERAAKLDEQKKQTEYRAEQLQAVLNQDANFVQAEKAEVRMVREDLADARRETKKWKHETRMLQARLEDAQHDMEKLKSVEAQNAVLQSTVQDLHVSLEHERQGRQERSRARMDLLKDFVDTGASSTASVSSVGASLASVDELAARFSRSGSRSRRRTAQHRDGHRKEPGDSAEHDRRSTFDSEF